MMNTKNQKNINSKVLYIALLLNIISYAILYYLNDFRSQISNYFLTLIPAYIGYFTIVFYRHSGTGSQPFYPDGYC